MALIDDYLDGPRLLRQAVAGMTNEQFLARPVPGKWSTLEVVCHPASISFWRQATRASGPKLVTGSPP